MANEHYIEDNEQEAIFQTMNIRIKSEDSVNVTSIVSFYDNVAETLGLDINTVRYDCTKIDVSRNIQENIFSAWEKMGASDLEIGMIWCKSGPKTDDKLPQDTISITHGFFSDENNKPLPFTKIAAKAQAFIDNGGKHYISNVPSGLNHIMWEIGCKWDPDAKSWFHADPVKAKEAERLVAEARERNELSAAQTAVNEITPEM